MQPKLQMLAHREFRENARNLELDAHPHADSFMRQHMIKIAAEKRNGPGTRTMLACNEFEEGTFPCTVRSDHASDLSFTNCKVDAVDHVCAAEMLRERV